MNDAALSRTQLLTKKVSPYPFFRHCEDDDPIYFSVLSYESKINVNVFAARVPRSQFSDIALLERERQDGGDAK